jgi:serine/threonine protein phosphatase 1
MVEEGATGSLRIANPNAMAGLRVLSCPFNFQQLRVRGRRPTLAPGQRIYAIGDIHGRIDLLDKLLARIDTDIELRPAERPLFVFLGDYVDRGPSSRETIDRLIEHGAAKECVFLRGNHELILVKCLNDPSLFEKWLRLGGVQTLISYGVPAEILTSGKQIVELQAALHGALPPAHFRFFRDLQDFFDCGDFFFAHAGVRPNIDLALQRQSDLLWIRDEFLLSNKDLGKIVVHGHTPTLRVEAGPNRINIDTGAYATGCLTCLVIEDCRLSVIDTL